MDRTSKLAQGADLRDHLAAERTLLAWVRTALSLMGFGFVAARFGVYLQQLAQHTSAAQPYGLSLWLGTASIAVGVAVNVFCGWQHAHWLAWRSI